MINELSAPPVAESPVDTCISQETFQKLALKLQIEYAVVSSQSKHSSPGHRVSRTYWSAFQYYKIPNARNLTSEEICAVVYANNEWIPALEGHLVLSTPNGLVVSDNVMDVVDWLVAEHSEGMGISSKG